MNQLEQGLTTLGLSLDAAARQQLINYLQLLEKWNKAYNLTSVRKPEQW